MPELRSGAQGTTPPAYAITPDEMDRYEVYTVINPAGANGISPTWFGTWPIAGTSAVGTLVLTNIIADYPRNLEFAIAGSAAGMTGTAHITGFNQFGEAQTEDLTFAGAANGGTVVGTKVWAQVTSGTLNFGTAVGNGTARLGVDVGGTTALFGLPVKIGATTDVKLLNWTTGTGAIVTGGGTIGTYVVAGNTHAIRAQKSVVGTISFQAWVRSTYNGENVAQVANLTQKA